MTKVVGNSRLGCGNSQGSHCTDHGPVVLRLSGFLAEAEQFVSLQGISGQEVRHLGKRHLLEASEVTRRVAVFGDDGEPSWLEETEGERERQEEHDGYIS